MEQKERSAVRERRRYARSKEFSQKAGDEVQNPIQEVQVSTAL